MNIFTNIKYKSKQMDCVKDKNVYYCRRSCSRTVEREQTNLQATAITIRSQVSDSSWGLTLRHTALYICESLLIVVIKKKVSTSAHENLVDKH